MIISIDPSDASSVVASSCSGVKFLTFNRGKILFLALSASRNVLIYVSSSVNVGSIAIGDPVIVSLKENHSWLGACNSIRQSGSPKLFMFPAHVQIPMLLMVFKI